MKGSGKSICLDGQIDSKKKNNHDSAVNELNIDMDMDFSNQELKLIDKFGSGQVGDKFV